MNNCTRILFKPVFEHDLSLLSNPVCAKCDAKLKHPLMPWLVGLKFPYSAERILFVGKPHRGKPGEILSSGMIDPTEMVEDSLWDIGWPYWSYTREIAENLYGPNASEYISFTNAIKCTNVGADDDKSDSSDKTSYQMANCCIKELGVIWKEVERLEPLTIIFYTYNLFRQLFSKIPIAIDGTIQNLTEENNTVQCRNKQLGWWERVCETPWTRNMRILVVGHPERMGRKEYVTLLTNYLKPNKANSANDTKSRAAD